MIYEYSKAQNPLAELKTEPHPRWNSYAILHSRYRCLERWNGELAVRPSFRPRFGIGRTCFATRATMHGFEGEYDGWLSASKRVDATTWDGVGKGSHYGANKQGTRSGKYVGTREVNTTEPRHRVCHPDPHPSLCRSSSGRGLERGELMIDCHPQPIARQVSMV